MDHGCPNKGVIITDRSRRHSRIAVFSLVAAVLIALAGVVGHALGRARATEALRADTAHRLDLFTSTAVLMINRLASIPGTIELNQDTVALLSGRGDVTTSTNVNRFLARLNAQLGSDAIFVADERGEVIGSSNAAQQDDSRLGEDIAARPYFQDALSGFVGRHFSLGEAPDTPGYFVSYPVHDGDRVVGTATTKISLRPVVEAFSLLGKPALIADRDNVVILSSQPEWLYTSLAPITVAQRVDLELTGVYGHHRVTQFPLAIRLGIDDPALGLDRVVPAQRSGTVTLPERLVQGQVLNGMDWKLLVFSDLADVRRQGLIAAALASLLTALVLTLALYLMQRRRAARLIRAARDALELANVRLEITVARRTQALTQTNADLRREMDERIRTEATLRATQDDLVQAAKLTALGELGAGIMHELAQPLGALQTHAGNAEEFLRRGDVASAQGNLAIIGGIVEKIDGIIFPLRSFLRKSPAKSEAVEVAQAVQNALLLLDARLRAADITVENACDGFVTPVWCNPNRIEQVLVNLIANACDAMQGSARRTLGIRAELQADGDVVITVEDSGPGLEPQQIDRLFVPFNTSKQTGLGLGLAISRGIAREYGGDLIAQNRPAGGAAFLLRLPQAQSRRTAWTSG
ncbi:sensor histidine kinase [Paracoccus limosus]|uniref:histidine kinase n=1 Tax=Paracoccus limosus TaxID=913252 RepID=A0A844H0C3_9RHOB|nr:ATP-binding protein [Paracoccus limosus]MTH34282.1 sensor histidine kinase [Paracoccus limosus]